MKITPELQERFAQIIKTHQREDDVQTVDGCRKLVDRMVAASEDREYVPVARNPDGSIVVEAPVAPVAPAEVEPAPRARHR